MATATERTTVRRPRLEDYRRQLQRKIADLRRALSSERAAEIVHRPEEPLDFGDWCQKSHDQWLFVNQNQLEIQLLRELEAALRRVEDGSFGVCAGCREPIPEKRLKALPWARLCMRCEAAPPE